jgi:hypothetical protein
MIALSLLAAGLVIYIVETPVTKYTTFAEAQADGAIERGWLPTFLPASATDIRDVHNIDTNARWLTFHAPIGDLRLMVQGFKPLAYAEARRTALPRSWRVGGLWPPELSEPLLATPRDTDLLAYYRAAEDDLCLAVEWRTGRAWAWSCGGQLTSRLSGPA